MNQYTMDTLIQAVDVAVVLILIFRVSRYIAVGKSMMPVHFLFALVALLTSDLYWLAYDLLYPGLRMPIAANMIGENAFFLLSAEALNMVFRDWTGDTRKETVSAILFTAASAALWIAWSGEWMQDILGALAFGWFLIAVVRGLKLSNTLTRREWVGICAVCTVLILSEALIFYVPGFAKNPLELFCYVLMFAGMGYCFFRVSRAKKKGAGAGAVLSLAFGGQAWGLSCMYMSSNKWYTAAYAIFMLFLLLTEQAAREAVTSA